MTSPVALSEHSIIARIERLPTSWWHVRTRIIVGVATFSMRSIAYDCLCTAGFDSAFKIAPTQIGPLIAIGFAGRRLHYFSDGRRTVWPLKWHFTTTIFGDEFSLRNSDELRPTVWYRFVQGFGLGGEVPIAAAYINEITRAKGRGKFFFMKPRFRGSPIVAIIGAWIVPRFGWQWLFVIGAIPALLTIVLRLWCPNRRVGLPQKEGSAKQTKSSPKSRMKSLRAARIRCRRYRL